MNKEVLLEVKDLKKWFPIDEKVFGKPSRYVKAVDGVSLSINKGEVLGLVGESGSGKTTISRSILGLHEITSGDIVFFGEKNIRMLKKKELRKMRSQVQMIFQDPYSSLSPRMKIGDTIAESLVIHKIGTKGEIRKRVEDLLEIVGLEKEHYSRYPHEFSGGQRQRIGIARVLAIDPLFIICDEPVSALDVSIRSQILNLLMDLRKNFNLTMLFVSHDLSVVEYLCDRIMVMYLGKVMEVSPKEALYSNPLHPYTEALLSAIPVIDPKHKIERIILEGDIPSPVNPPEGCRFSTRCPRAKELCRKKEPLLLDQGNGHMAACHYPNEVKAASGAVQN